MKERKIRRQRVTVDVAEFSAASGEPVIMLTNYEGNGPIRVTTLVLEDRWAAQTLIGVARCAVKHYLARAEREVEQLTLSLEGK